MTNHEASVLSLTPTMKQQHVTRSLKPVCIICEVVALVATAAEGHPYMRALYARKLSFWRSMPSSSYDFHSGH
ncbi:hypothetical protein A0H81_06099 [Grifola frondosa]|uniref:Uncharacterized protein n=1 Tax=Grifola frondosa TaxID=5627 RepID=A0A1C7MAK4_GRIFR|nr:hypothetical protein A0H81_06099 [Grifola frondosa]